MRRLRTAYFTIIRFNRKTLFLLVIKAAAAAWKWIGEWWKLNEPQDCYVIWESDEDKRSGFFLVSAEIKLAHICGSQWYRSEQWEKPKKTVGSTLHYSFSQNNSNVGLLNLIIRSWWRLIRKSFVVKEARFVIVIRYGNLHHIKSLLLLIIKI